MDKSVIIWAFASYCLVAFLKDTYYRFIYRGEEEEETFWDSHQFENSLEDLFEVGYTFQKNEIIYKKISGEKWFAEILIPDDDEFEIGCELTIDNYIYKKIGEKAWTIEKIN